MFEATLDMFGHPRSEPVITQNLAKFLRELIRAVPGSTTTSELLLATNNVHGRRMLKDNSFPSEGLKTWTEGLETGVLPLERKAFTRALGNYVRVDSRNRRPISELAAINPEEFFVNGNGALHGALLAEVFSAFSGKNT